ncbi:MAG: cytochrome c oxidase accessory protein CcoG [Gammaproteobacteria bacterium]|nr:cytochrome c oxidase accessory protein CcoG [Gammaproteobacteria bacterium]
MISNNGSELLYAAHEKIYPREVKGTFQSLRNYTVILLLGIYYFLPWIKWDSHQAVLFDLPARKFYIFSLTFWPQDFYYLTWLMVIASITLFLTTAIAGRLWCGYACPQTVWTEIFIWMERWAEGDRNSQIKLDKSSWNVNKIWRKSLKQFLWIGFSAWTGFTFVGYFTPISELGQELLTVSLGPWEFFWVVFYGFATYGNAGFMREQVCKYMCPYARFQSAMFDRDTLIIAYDEKRGEPRGHRKKGASQIQALGDCVACDQCVQVCPTGIDIRDGLQYECIACGACIDACNNVMDKMGYCRNLIRYTTENITQTGGVIRLIRLRTVLYTFVWLFAIVGFLFAISQRVPLDLDVIRDRNALYQTVDEDSIENVYTLKIMNKDRKTQRYQVSVSGLPGITTVPAEITVEVASGEVYNLPVRARAALDSIQRMSSEIEFKVATLEAEAQSVHETTRFLAPL